MKPARDDSFDALRGALILLVVLGHYLEIIPSWGWQKSLNPPILISHTLLSFFYITHIPCLVFLSGLWFNPNKALWRVRRLFGYYLLFQTLYVACHYLLRDLYHLEHLTFIVPYWLLWFLMALMLWHTLTLVLLKIPTLKALWLLLSLMAGYAIAFLPTPAHHLYFSIGRVMVFLPLFLLGAFYGQTILETVKHLPKALCIGLLLMLPVVLHSFPQYEMWFFGRANAYEHHEDLMGVLKIQSALWALSFISIICLLRLRHHLWRGFILWGMGSFAIYLLHGLAIEILRAYFMVHDFPLADPILSLLVAWVFSVLICHLAVKAKLIRL
ncbi:MAG: acyltransferase family protein [Cardiobacteriaceae bacterium]|nr:acyltransferase family protein [Cardiobacteriaceae bacterium]